MTTNRGRIVQVFMGDDGRFVVARDGLAHWEHRTRLDIWVERGTVRCFVRRKPKRFWTRDRRYYWDVRAWVEIGIDGAPANDGRN